MINNSNHITVLLNETVDELELVRGNIIVDCTLGSGGHSLKILEELEACQLVCLDSDFEAIKNFREVLISKDFQLIEEKGTVSTFKNVNKLVHLVHDNFSNIENILKILELGEVNGIIADLGWSSDQLDGVDGLSFSSKNSVLDMRFDRNLGVTAADLLNALGKSELEKMFERYGDFNKVEVKVLAGKITEKRKIARFTKTSDLNDFIESIQSKLGNRAQKNINQLKARVYQCLRIAVNSEYENLRNLISGASKVLAKNGNLNIITFHSGEEKIVESFCTEANQFVVKKTILPSTNEIRQNKRSRSAKLWIISKI